jgi:hypothetical protein
MARRAESAKVHDTWRRSNDRPREHQEPIMTIIKRIIQGVLIGKAIQWFRNRNRTS